MASHKIIPSTSPLIDGRVKRKPKIYLSQGVIERLTLNQPLDVAIARTTVRKLADDAGYSLIDQLRISSAIFEIADNIVTHAGQGEIVISWVEDSEHKGLQFFCNDQGLHAPQLAYMFGSTNHHQADAAFNATSPQKLVDAFKFVQDPKLGNCINISIWLD